MVSGRIVIFAAILAVTVGCRSRHHPQPAVTELPRPKAEVKAETDRLVALIPSDMRPAPVTVDRAGFERYQQLQRVFATLPPPPPQREADPAQTQLARLSSFGQWLGAPGQIDNVRRIVRSGPISVEPRDSGMDRARQLMPGPLWYAAVLEAQAHQPDAAADDFVLAVKYCRAAMPQPNAIQRAWLMTLSAIQACVDAHLLNAKGAAKIAAELPDVGWVRKETGELIKRRLADDVGLIGQMQAPIEGQTMANAGGQPYVFPPYGNLDRNDTVRMMVQLARGDLENAMRSKEQYSNANFVLRLKLKGDLPELRVDGDDSSAGEMQAAIDAFALEMNRTPNSLGRARLRAMGAMDFEAVWRLEDQLSKLHAELSQLAGESE